MLDKEALLKGIAKIEDKLVVSRILDKAAKAEYAGCFTYTDFLDPYQKTLAARVLSRVKDINHVFYGGHPDAERNIVGFPPDFATDPLESSPEDLLQVVKISVASKQVLSHRDYLGSLMGLGIKREKIGDILVQESSCDVIVLYEVADYIRYNLMKIGSSKVSVEVCSIEDVTTADRTELIANATVASLRLDCILGSGLGLSRSKAAELISSERVSVNWETVASLTRQLKEGDTISVRGKGRLILKAVNHTTRKGRISVTISRFK